MKSLAKIFLLVSLALVQTTLTAEMLEDDQNWHGLIGFKKLYSVQSADQYSGSDIGAKVNAAFSAIGNVGTVFIPSGTYTFSTTIDLPVGTNGQSELACSSGT